MRFRGQYRHDTPFAKALLKANVTMVEMVKRATPQAKTDTLTFFLMYLIILVILVMAFMLWYDHMPQLEHYPHGQIDDIRQDFEDWLLEQEGFDGETAPLFAGAYKGVNETPLSPDEVRRITDLVRADERIGYGTMVSRKRKAAEDADESEDKRSGSPRAQKLKIETDFGVGARWVSDRLTASPGDMSYPNISDAYSTDCETPFTFRAPLPDRTIKAAVKQRK
ncbi:MAG: hypothetical protein Q9186_003080 [Xanthomendoza sp. 1 TL-2023]